MINYIKISPNKYQVVLENKPKFISLNSTFNFVSIIKQLENNSITEKQLLEHLKEQESYKGTVYYMFGDDEYNFVICDSNTDNVCDNKHKHYLGMYSSKEQLRSAHPEYFI